ncbi:MAG: hypothetical protein WC749_12570, partial [Dehalococcoidia bacterium]
MILLSITVANWRCYLNPVTIGPFSQGLNIIYAPNATGKSTLFEALRRGLMDGHKVTGKDTESIRPWGRSLAPSVIIEFSHEGMDYRLTKRFLEGATSKLERKENSRFVPLAEGQNADEQVRSILSRNPPGRGLSRSDNWGMAQVLWAPQGDLVLKALSGDLMEDVRASLGRQVSGSGAGTLEKRINDLFFQFFTPGGKLKTGKDAPALAKLQERREEISRKRVAALEQLQRFDETSRRVEDLRARQTQARLDAEAIGKTLKDIRLKVDTYKVALSEKNQCNERFKASSAQYNELKGRIDHIQAVRKELAEATTLLGQLEESIPLQEREVESRQKAEASTRLALENVRKERPAVDEAQQLAEEAYRFTENDLKLREVDERIRRATKAEESLRACLKQRSEILAPDSKMLRGIRKAIKERDEAQLLIDSALITLEIVSLKAGSIEVLEGEKLGSQRLLPGSTTQIKGSPQVVADLVGIARLRASGPSGTIEEHRKAKAAADRTLGKLLEPFGITDLEKLEKLQEQADDKEKEIAKIQSQMEMLLNDQTVNDIGKERSRLQAIRATALAKHPQWEANPPESERLKVIAKESNRSFIARVEAAEPAHYAAQTALAAAIAQKTKASTQCDATRSHVTSIQSRLAGITSDSKSDEQRVDELKRLALDWDAARAGLEKAEKQISSLGDDPTVLVGKLEKQMEAADAASRKTLESEKIEEGRLETMAAEGPYSVLALLDEEMANLT